MRISFIIPVLNERAVVTDSIDRAWSAGADEVIIADGGSNDGTAQAAKSGRCEFVESSAGRAAQMNAGSTIATGDVLLFMHADNWLVENGCDQVRDTLRQADHTWGGFRQRIEDPRAIFRWIEFGNALRCQWQSLVYGDQGLFVKRDSFESLGGFPNLSLMEDFELSKRLASQTRPALLPGPIHVSARRWNSTGVLRQTLRNWKISTAYRFGVSADRLAKWYDA